MRNKLFFIVALVVGFLVAAISMWLLWPKSCTGPVTCSSNEQCGGKIVQTYICQDDVLYAQGQENICNAPKSCDSVCQTNYGEWAIKKCSKGCLNGACQ